MGAADAIALTLALVANLVAMAAVAVMWRRGRHRRRAVRSRHPSTRPPVSIRTIETAFGRRFRLDIARNAPTMAIDIVSFQRANVRGDHWQSEPLITPLVIEPGGYAVLLSELPPDVFDFDVVIAWTARHPIGEVQGSLLFRLPPERSERSSSPGGPSLQVLPALALLVLLALSFVVIATELVGSIGDDDAPGRETPTTAVEIQEGAASEIQEGAAPSSITGTNSTSTTDATPTTARVSSAGPVPPAAPITSGSSSTTVSSDGPQVAAEATQGECRFGSDCLIVGFTISGFQSRPQEYICEFDDGSRFAFRFDSGGVENACASGSTDAAITVEVGGVRSNTLSRADV